jgi:hypothetical protein
VFHNACSTRASATPLNSGCARVRGPYHVNVALHRAVWRAWHAKHRRSAQRREDARSLAAHSGCHTAQLAQGCHTDKERACAAPRMPGSSCSPVSVTTLPSRGTVESGSTAVTLTRASERASLGASGECSPRRNLRLTWESERPSRRPSLHKPPQPHLLQSVVAPSDTGACRQLACRREAHAGASARSRSPRTDSGS